MHSRAELETAFADAGAVGLAPSAATVKDVLATVEALSDLRSPDRVEVDDSDGSVAFEWANACMDGTATFCLSWDGDGMVVGTLSPFRDGCMPWTCPVGDASTVHGRVSAVLGSGESS